MNPNTNDGNFFMNLFKNRGFMGITKTNRNKNSKSYKRMKLKQIRKRRIRNKIARKSRRINRQRND